MTLLRGQQGSFKDTAGILPTVTQSTFIQQVYKQQNNPILSPVIQEMIKAHDKTIMFDPHELEGGKDKEGNTRIPVGN
jgi:hypothetical protein